ncbi:MAG TPA: DUF4440 domain-containing protein [Gemmatimonadales bacterium]|nr:DUF4440 domain-containing protein [Gemmatimonadales bacterium]
MSPRFSVLLASALLSGLACRAAPDPGAATKNLLAVDVAWSSLAKAGGDIDSIVAFWTPDARLILPDQEVLVGTAAIRQMVAGTRNVPGFEISWAPDSAIVAASGDLGYTYGTNRVTAPDAQGHLAAVGGRYVTIWKRGTDGRWRCAVDIYNVGAPAGAPKT